MIYQNFEVYYKEQYIEKETNRICDNSKDGAIQIKSNLEKILAKNVDINSYDSDAAFNLAQKMKEAIEIISNRVKSSEPEKIQELNVFVENISTKICENLMDDSKDLKLKTEILEKEINDINEKNNEVENDDAV